MFRELSVAVEDGLPGQRAHPLESPLPCVTSHRHRESGLAAMVDVIPPIRRNKINAKLKELQAAPLPEDYEPGDVVSVML